MDNIRNKLEKLRNEVWHIFQMDYNKRADFIPSILGRIDGILDTPKRNCDVGTAEEQYNRFIYCCTARKIPCQKSYTRSCTECYAKWLQMPYEQEGEE